MQRSRRGGARPAAARTTARPARDALAVALTLLLATLGIMIGLFTVTGFINRMGGMLLDLGSWNIVAMIGMAYLFGWLVGAGLPPTATYIIGAVVIVGPLRELLQSEHPWVRAYFHGKRSQMLQPKAS